MPLRFGIFLNVQQPDAVPAAQIIDEACAQTRLARDLGFEIVAAGQHFLTEPYQMPQSIPLLARVAADAGDMRICSGITLLTLLNPVEVAENVVTLDAISGGRYVFGVGLGYRHEENEAFALPEKRVRVFLDKLEVVRRLLEGETVTASGHGYRLENARLTMLPVQRPRPPIWIAANNDSAVVRAARYADTWMVNPHTKVDALERQVGIFHEARVAAGLPPVTELPTVKELYVGEDDASADAEARPYLQGKYQSYVRWGQSDVLPSDDTLMREWDDLKAGGRFVLGGPATCVAQLQEQIDRLGIDTFCFRFGWPGMPDAMVQASMRRAAERVFPQLRPR